MIKAFYSVTEVADIYGVTVQAVRKWLHAGLFQGAELIGEKRGYWIIPVATLDSFKPPRRGRPRKGVKSEE